MSDLSLRKRPGILPWTPSIDFWLFGNEIISWTRQLNSGSLLTGVVRLLSERLELLLWLKFNLLLASQQSPSTTTG